MFLNGVPWGVGTLIPPRLTPEKGVPLYLFKIKNAFYFLHFVWCRVLSFVGGIDTSYSKREKILYVGILLIYEHVVKRIISEILAITSIMHFRELGRKTKNTILRKVDNIADKYSKHILFRVLVVHVGKRLSTDKLSFIERFTSIFLRAHKVSRFYVCSDLNRGSYKFANALRNRTGLECIVEDDQSNLVSLADIFINWYRIRKPKFEFISEKIHHC